jgi:hypothetical protein
MKIIHIFAFIFGSKRWRFYVIDLKNPPKVGDVIILGKLKATFSNK